MMRRVLVGQFMFEANTFSAGVASAVDFTELALDRGSDRGELRSRPGELGAACQALEKGGYEAIPSVFAASGPGSVLRSSVVAEIVAHATAAVTDVGGGCYFALHGAAVSETDDDPEGTLLEALRLRLGERPLEAPPDGRST